MRYSSSVDTVMLPLDDGRCIKDPGTVVLEESWCCRWITLVFVYLYIKKKVFQVVFFYVIIKKQLLVLLY